MYMYMEKNEQVAGHSRDGCRAALRIGERDASSFLAPLAILYPLPKAINP